MRDGTCDKCGTAAVMQRTGGIYPAGGTANPTVFVNDGTMVQRTVDYETFLCTACGYYENYVTDVGKLQNVATPGSGWARPAG